MVLARTAVAPEYRQVLAVDAGGGSAIHSGPNALGIWAEAHDHDVACGGNLLASPLGQLAHMLGGTLLQLAMPLAFALLFLQGLAELFKSIARLRGGIDAEAA